MKEILDVIHKTIYQFFDVCGDDEEVPMSDKDKLLLKVNKAICNNLKALEQEPCEDCISRAEFEERIKPYDTSDGMDQALYNFAHNKMICCPSVTPARPKGRWIHFTDDISDYVKCSCCGYGEEGEVKFDDKTLFCSHCGAEMEAEK